MSEIDKQSIRADQYEETTKYAPDRPPKPKQSVDPSVHTTLDSITDHGPTKAQYITQIKEALQKVHDPEITIDIYNLGLIYDVKVTEDKVVHVLMTLTSAFCPAADQIPLDIIGQVTAIEGITNCQVKITMQPQWGKEMIEPSMRSLMNL